jgi:hypothetical protein
MSTNNILLSAYLKKLKIPQSAKVYAPMAREAEDSNLIIDLHFFTVYLTGSSSKL